MKNLKVLFLISIILHCLSLDAQVDSVGNTKLVMDINGHTLKIPYFSSHSLDTTNNDIKQAVIVVHGSNRNADTYFDNMTTAAIMRPTETDSLLIIAPQFLKEADLIAFSLDSEHLFWSSGGWKSGSISRDNDLFPRPERISSYAVVDTILQKIANNFPGLESVVFTGHSAGGQFTNRYMATSPFARDLCNQYQISIKFIVANPSSYVYVDDQRRIAGEIDLFEVPSTSCTEYNDWKYGLDNLYSYPSASGVDSINSYLENRQVVYLLGENDNNPNSSSLDTSCAAMLQGDHRLERGSIYFNYLKNYFGNQITNTHSLDTIPNTGHSNLDMYTSTLGLYHLFESYPIDCINNFPPPPSGCIYTQIISDEFESSYGNWNDGGGDCYRSTSYPNTGNYSIRIRDNSGSSSSLTSDALDLSAYTDVKIEFSYYAVSMENNEDFILEVSNDNGATYSIYQSWVSNTDFTNNIRYNESIELMGIALSSNMRFRFRCDASSNGDKIYLDDIIVSACNDGGSQKVFPTAEIISLEDKLENDVIDNIFTNSVNLQIFPNPSNNEVSITFGNNIYSNSQIIVSNFNGKIIIDKIVKKEIDVVLLNVSQLELGTYFIHLKTEHNIVSKKLLIIR